MSIKSFKPHESAIKWLLDPSNPSVRYWTLLDLVSSSRNDSNLREAHDGIQNSNDVREILQHQLSDGSWRGAKGDIWEEKGTVFSLLLLAELGVVATGATKRAFDHLHENYQLPSGRITYRRAKRIGQKEQASTWMWCITAAFLRAGALLGHLEHPAVQNAIGFFQDTYSDEGGWYCSAYSGNPSKVHPPNCYMGTIKALGAFSAIPRQKRSGPIKLIIENEVKTCFENEVCYYRINRKGEPTIKRAWLKFAFPRYWRSDILEAADVLTSLGVHDSRMNRAAAIVTDKMQEDGRWLMDFSETKRAWIQIESEGSPSKWITLRALRVLNRLSWPQNLKSLRTKE